MSETIAIGVANVGCELPQVKLWGANPYPYTYKPSVASHCIHCIIDDFLFQSDYLPSQERSIIDFHNISAVVNGTLDPSILFLN
jgi:hypothetical protein